MTFQPNSVEARDSAYQLHAYVDLKKHEETGSTVMERGEGVYVFDNTGKKYIEGMAGLWSVALGFGETRLAEVAYEQMKKLPYYHTFSYKTNGPSVDLAEKLIEISPVPMEKVHFTSSGSEANDLVAKMVWYRSNALGQPERKKLIGRVRGYHGVTIASASLTGIGRNHESFDLPLDRMIHTSCPDYINLANEGETELEYSKRLAAELEELILKEGPETIAAMWGEPVLGAGGAVTPPEGYWAEIQAVLKKYDILLVADEVICGFGRTGNMFACTTYGIEPDVLVLSKQISSSYMPLSAILVNKKFYDPIAEESHKLGAFGHGYTASGHPVATAVGLENLKIIEERDLVGNVQRLAPKFKARLEELSKHPLGRAFRCVGMIGALELKPSDKPGEVAGAVSQAAMEEGVITRNSFVECLCFCPPLIMTEAEMDEMFDAVGRAMDKVLAMKQAAE